MARTCIHKFNIYETYFVQQRDNNLCQTEIAQEYPTKLPAIAWKNCTPRLDTYGVQRALEPAGALYCGVPGNE